MVKTVLALGVVLIVIGLGVVAYSFFKPPEAASGPIEAVPVAVEQNRVAVAQPTPASPTQAPDTAEPEPTIGVVATAAATATSEPDAFATNEPEATAPPMAEAAESGTASEVNPNPVVFEILQSDSEARFIIDEVLNGAPKTVVGATDQVAREIAIYPDDPASSIIGPILVNARTLATDNEFRNRAIKNRILSTDDYEFVTFTPTEIVGLPDSVSIGESFTFQIVGDLTVRNATREVTFDAAVTPISETELEGTAITFILYADFGLTIPEAPAVAGVDDEVRLEIDFVAAAK